MLLSLLPHVSCLSGSYISAHVNLSKEKHARIVKKINVHVAGVLFKTYWYALCKCATDLTRVYNYRLVTCL
jgi:hypothetical protein